MSDAITSHAIKEIERLVSESKKTAFERNDWDPPQVAWKIGPDGHAEKLIVDPKPLAVVLDTPDALVNYANAEADKQKAEFYCSETRIILVLDKAVRRDIATCPLPLSPQYAWLKGKTEPRTQRDFIRLLRIELRGCLPPDSNLLTLARSLKWQTNAETTGNVQHGKESMGRNIDSQVSGPGSIPEEIALTVPVFESFPYRARIACAIDVQVSDQKLQLVPYPLEVDRAMHEAMTEIMLLLSSTELPCYEGKP